MICLQLYLILIVFCFYKAVEIKKKTKQKNSKKPSICCLASVILTGLFTIYKENIIQGSLSQRLFCNNRPLVQICGVCQFTRFFLKVPPPKIQGI